MSRSFFSKKFILVLTFLLYQSCVIAYVSNTDTRIVDIRYWQGPENAQLIFDLSDKANISSLERLSDGTLYFDIEKCKFKPGKARFELNNEFINALNVQMRIDGKVRIYFRTPTKIVSKLFLLQKDELKPHRVVLYLALPSDEISRQTLKRIEDIRKLKKENVKIIVIDPGHGGEDPGTVHNGIVEKHYVLEMAHLLKSFFDYNPNYKAILTRTGDYIVPLDRRRQMAEQLGADVFVSFHVNYNKVRSIRGIEIYYESLKGAANEAERIVSEIENKQDEVIDIVHNNSIGITNYFIDKAKFKNDIINKQAEIMYYSGKLANVVEHYLSRAIENLPSRGVKRAGFRVLHSLVVPSILVELGYISNYYDANILKDSNSKVKLAEAIYNGVKAFLEAKHEYGKEEGYIEFASNYSPNKRKLIKPVLSAKPGKNTLAKADFKKRKNTPKRTILAKKM